MEAAKTILEDYDDRRDALRQSIYNLTVRVDTGAETSQEGLLLDVSRTGLRFRTVKNIPCGSSVIVHPPVGVDLAPISATVLRVKVVEGHDGSSFECGVRFEDAEELRRHNWWLQLRRRRR